VQIRHGPAAVSEDENHKPACECFIENSRGSHCTELEPNWATSEVWEGVVSRMIRKSEDLPEKLRHLHSVLMKSAETELRSTPIVGSRGLDGRSGAGRCPPFELAFYCDDVSDLPSETAR